MLLIIKNKWQSTKLKLYKTSNYNLKTYPRDELEETKDREQTRKPNA